MNVHRIIPLAIAIFFTTASAVWAQESPHVATGPQAAPPSMLVSSALSNVQATTSGLNVARWQAPRSARQTAEQNVNSIQRDLGIQIPGLVARADGAPNSVPRSFELYRNIDALYDVLLRVSRTADLAAPHEEAAAVSSALEHLEQARTALGTQILRVAEAQQSRLAAFERRAPETAPARSSSAPSEHESVVVDGPARPSGRKAREHDARQKNAKPSPDVPAAASGRE